MTLPAGLKAGDMVLLSEPFSYRGLGQLRGESARNGTTYLEIAMTGSSGKRVFIPRERAHVLEKPMGRAEAERIVAAFSAPESLVPDERDFEQQSVDTTKAVVAGDWDDMQRALSRLYAFAWKPAFGHRRLMDMCETLLVPVLAHALGRDHDELVAELREGKPAFAATVPRPAATPPEPKFSPAFQDLEPLFPITVTGELSFCDSPGAPAAPNERIATLRVRPGTWHSYARRTEDAEELYLVHESHVADGRAELLEKASWWRAGEIARTRGTGSICVIDGAAREDVWTLDRLLFWGGDYDCRGRAFMIETQGWDGPLPILVAGDVPDRVKIVIG